MSEGRTFSKGMKAGIPIGLGYFAVAFSLGVTAHDCGFNAFQGFLSSFTTYASAGQYMGFTMYAANVTLLQYIAIIAITNARYLLMGVALNQKLPAGTSPAKRLMLGATITDEIFGISIAQPGGLNPEYPLGALIVAMPLWSFGTALGITMGNLLPLRAVSALSVCLYGMFLAVIIPPSRKDKTVGIFVAISFAASFASKYISGVRNISEGNRVILLTVVISAVAALLFPVKCLRHGDIGTASENDADSDHTDDSMRDADDINKCAEGEEPENDNRGGS